MNLIRKLRAILTGFFKFVVGKVRGTKNDDFVLSRPWINFYDQDVPPDFFIPDITLNDLIRRSFEFYPHQNAFVYYGAGFTYTELQKFILGTAAGLAQLGLKKGDRIALFLPNTPQLIISYWAALRLGVIVALINPLLAPREVKKTLELARPRALVVLDRLYQKNKGVINSAGIPNIIHTAVDAFMPNMTRFVYFLRSGFGSKDKTGASEMMSFDRLYIKNVEPPTVEVNSQDGAVLLFTGGVTGTPKAVLLQHKQLVANVLQTRLWMATMNDGKEVVLGVLPFAHSYGMTVCHHLSIQSGSMLILEPRFKTGRIIRLLSRYNVSVFPGVPTMFHAIIDALKEKNNKLKKIKFCVSGGAPLPTRLKNEFEQWSNSRLLEGYGLTEASPITHCMPVENRDKVGSIGLPCSNTDAKIIDLKTGRPLPPNEVGELLVKGPQVMSGYWQNDIETELVLKNGWLHTGDLAKMDEDGYFYIVDRKKDVILSGGFNVYPSEVEEVLNLHPYIAESAAVGIADEFFGEGVKVFVVFKAGCSCSEDDLADYCKKNLAVYKRPSQYEVVRTLPKNFIGKIIRRQLI